MSSQEISIKLEARETVRKGLGQLRSDGWVPAVLHNHGQESTLVMGEYVPLSKVYSQAGKHHPVQVQIGDKKHLALIRQVDVEPTKQRIRHVVFQAIRQNEAVEAEIPVILEGDIPAEKASLMVITNIDHVQVSALPNNLPDQLTVDATTLVEPGDSLAVSDIIAPEGVTILTDPDTQVCNVERPRDQIAEADAAQEALATDSGVPDEEAEVTEGEETEAGTDQAEATEPPKED